jgi:hypothetical protein
MVGNWFLRFGALFGLGAIGLGIYMGYQHDLKLSPVQIQVAMIGWISLFLAGLFYSSIASASEYVETIGSLIPKSAGLHFFIALIGAIALVAGSVGVTLDLTYTGQIGSQAFDHFAWGDKVMFGGEILTGVAQLLFMLNVLRGTTK